MHQAAVYVLCALAAWFSLQNARVLFIAWYSGVEPALAPSVRVRLWVEMVVAITAATIALITV